MINIASHIKTIEKYIVTLDFRDIFAQGFAFDSITSDAKINQGIMETKNFKMFGVAATVLMEGTINIPNESQNLQVAIMPDVNAGAVSLAYGLINPAIGIGTFIAQLFLRDPLMKQLTYHYNVTGTWQDPQMTKVK